VDRTPTLRLRDRVQSRSFLHPIAWRTGAAGALIWGTAIAVLSAPYVFSLPGVGLDPSWIVGLQMAVRQHLHWGTQVVWTYGPLGFADVPAYVYFETWAIGTAVTLVIHLLFCSTLALFLWRQRPKWWECLLLGMIFILPIPSSPTTEAGVTAVLLLALALASADRPLASLSVVLAGCLLGLMSLMKGTGLIEAAAVVPAFTVACLIWRRWTLVPTIVLSLMASFVVLWLLAGQPLSGIPPYLRTSYEISSGYTAAMSLIRENANPFARAQLAPALIVVIMPALAAAFAFIRGERLSASLAWLSLPFVFLGFKEGFIRGGGHYLYFYATAMLLQTPLWVNAMRSRNWLAAVPAGVAAITCAALLGFGGRYMAPAGPPPLWGAQSLASRVQSYPIALRLLLQPASRAETTRASVRKMRAYYHVPGPMLLPLRSGTVDIAPFDIEIAYAYGLAWRPRPILQTYSAYTPLLDELDAEHFTGDGAPDRVLFYTFAAADYRYPMFEEPRTTWALLHRYRVERTSDLYVLLVRDRNPPVPALRLLGTVKSPLSRVVDVPGGPRDVRAAIDLPQSVRGRALNLVFRPSELHVSFIYDDGRRSSEYRFISQTAVDGDPVGWYVADTLDLASYVEGHPAHRIRSFMITADNPADYITTYQVTFYGTS
jgi:hypothetical protein